MRSADVTDSEMAENPLGAIADASTQDGTARVPPVLMQPVAADDVVAALADVPLGEPVNGIVELAGPELMRLDELFQRVLSVKQDARHVIGDAHALYFGAKVTERSLTPGGNRIYSDEHAVARPSWHDGNRRDLARTARRAQRQTEHVGGRRRDMRCLVV